jgi:hypothetical protein
MLFLRVFELMLDSLTTKCLATSMPFTSINSTNQGPIHEIFEKKNYNCRNWKTQVFLSLPFQTVMLWLICRHRYFGLGFCTYMKVIFSKNLTFITIIYHTQFQFEKMSRTMKFFWNFCVFYVLKKGLKSANFPRIQTFSQIETLYGK